MMRLMSCVVVILIFFSGMSLLVHAESPIYNSTLFDELSKIYYNDSVELLEISTYSIVVEVYDDYVLTKISNNNNRLILSNRPNL